MKALVIEGPEKLRLVDKPIPDVGWDDVLIRVEYVGICGSDIHAQEGRRLPPWIRFPVVLGHEFSGRVERTGEGARHLAPGTPVAVEGVVRCGTCPSCARGDSNLCDNYSEIGFIRDGAFAEFVVAPARLVHRLSDDIDLKEAAMVEPLSCVAQATDRAGIQPGDTVLITGDGPIGLLALLASKLHGAGRTLVSGIVPERLELARSLGADAVSLADQESVKAFTLRETDGDGADRVIECSGAAAVAEVLPFLARRCGSVSIIGISGGATVPVSYDDFVTRDLLVRGSAGYTQKYFARAIHWIASRQVDVRPLITHAFALSDWEWAFTTVRCRKDGVVKAVVTPN